MRIGARETHGNGHARCISVTLHADIQDMRIREQVDEVIRFHIEAEFVQTCQQLVAMKIMDRSSKIHQLIESVGKEDPIPTPRVDVLYDEDRAGPQSIAATREDG